MIPIKQTITHKGVGFTAREWRAMLKQAWQYAGQYWHHRILPKHFTRQGALEYKYQARSRRHEIRKAKKFGHRRPLVFSGMLESAVKGTRDVRASTKGARVVLHGPTHLYAYRKNFNQPDKAKELATISERDAQTLAKLIDYFLQQHIDVLDQTGRAVRVA